MSHESDIYQKLNSIQFFVTPPHACSYFSEREAITLFADPYARMTTATYTLLSQIGFRRSGNHVYRPHCPACQACVAVRVNVNEFKPTRSQQRIWKRNQHLSVQKHDCSFQIDQYALYHQYISIRHQEGGMSADEENYRHLLECDWCDTALYVMSSDEAPEIVAITDHLQDGLSAVYTFFNPLQPKQGFGVYAVLWQIQHARELGLEWVYLGYWIADHAKMAYKTGYQPLQLFDGHDWVDFIESNNIS